MNLEELKESIAGLALDSLPEEWIETVWAGGFKESFELPIELWNEISTLDDCIDRMNEVISSVKIVLKWLKRIQNPSELEGTKTRLWSEILDSGLNLKSLICFLSSFLKFDKPVYELNDSPRINAAIYAARCYINFITLPGASVFNAFNFNLFDLCFEMLDLIHLAASGVKKPNKKNKGRKKSKDEEAEEETNESLNEGDSSLHLSEVDKRNILKEICTFLDEAECCLNEIKLKNEVNSLEVPIRKLAYIISHERETNVLKTTNLPEKNTVTFAVWKAFDLLEKFCSGDHGRTEDTIKTIYIAFKPLVFTNLDNLKMSIKENTIGRSSVFSFMERLVEICEEQAQDRTVAFIMQILIQVPDKSDIRASMCNDLAKLTNSLPSHMIEHLVLFCAHLANAALVKQRITALEFISKMLTLPDKTEKQNIHNFLVSIFISHLFDASPLIRFKCVSKLASIIISTQKELLLISEKLFLNVQNIHDETPVTDSDLIIFPGSASKDKENNEEKETKIQVPDVVLPSANKLVKALMILSNDVRVYVRKSATTALCNICLVSPLWINDKLLEIIVGRCLDNSVMIRKEITSHLTELVMKYPSNNKVIEAWVRGTLSLMADNDSKCQELITEFLYDIIIKNIKEFNAPKTPENILPWKVIKMISKLDKRRELRLACKTWSGSGAIKKPLFDALISHTGGENDSSSWFLIATLSEFLDFPYADFIADYFFKQVESFNQSNDSLASLVATSLFLNIQGLSRTVKETTYERFKSLIEKFEMPFWLIGKTFDALALMKKPEFPEWCDSVKESCKHYILSKICGSNSSGFSGNLMCCYVFTLGEVCSYRPPVDPDLVKAVAKMIDSSCVTAEDEDGHPNIGRWNGKVSNRVKAVCVVTLGKLCIQDVFLAKRYVRVLAFILNNPNTDVNVKINAVSALADLCVRFTSVVEDYIGDLCLALKDSSDEVRRSSLKNISQLIIEDYLRMRSPLFFYLLFMVLDPEKDIAERYESFMVNCVVKKQQHIMSQFFVQSIFFFNDYELYFNKEGLSDQEKLKFNLAGVNNAKHRETIYRFMLRNMEDNDRFNVQNLICSDILDKVNEDVIALDSKGLAVLEDALISLGLEEMRLEHLKKTDEDDKEQPQDEDLALNYVISLSRKMFLSALLKKNYMEELVPVVVKLKHKLRDLKSPLSRTLMRTMREMMKDFRKEVEEIFGADPELAKELEFDLRECAGEEEQLNLDDLVSEITPEVHNKMMCLDMIRTGQLEVERTIEQISSIDSNGTGRREESRQEESERDAGGELGSTRSSDEGSRPEGSRADHDDLSTEYSTNTGDHSASLVTSRPSAKRRSFTLNTQDSEESSIASPPPMERKKRVTEKN